MVTRLICVLVVVVWAASTAQAHSELRQKYIRYLDEPRGLPGGGGGGRAPLMKPKNAMVKPKPLRSHFPPLRRPFRMVRPPFPRKFNRPEKPFPPQNAIGPGQEKDRPLRVEYGFSPVQPTGRPIISGTRSPQKQNQQQVQQQQQPLIQQQHQVQIPAPQHQFQVPINQQQIIHHNQQQQIVSHQQPLALPQQQLVQQQQQVRPQHEPLYYLQPPNFENQGAISVQQSQNFPQRLPFTATRPIPSQQVSAQLPTTPNVPLLGFQPNHGVSTPNSISSVFPPPSPPIPPIFGNESPFTPSPQLRLSQLQASATTHQNPFGISNHQFNAVSPKPQALPLVGNRPPTDFRGSASRDIIRVVDAPTFAESSTTEKARALSTKLSLKTAGNKATLKEILAEDCSGAEDFGFCASPPRYPTLQIAQQIKNCKALLGSLYVPIPDTLDPPTTQTNKANNERGNKDGWSWASYGSKKTQVCESEFRYLEPGYAREVSGKWMVVLQAKEMPQRVAMDMCKNPGGVCKNLADCGIKSRCVQRYTHHHLIAWDPDTPEECPAVRVFKFPTSCVCHIATDHHL